MEMNSTVQCYYSNHRLRREPVGTVGNFGLNLSFLSLLDLNDVNRLKGNTIFSVSDKSEGAKPNFGNETGLCLCECARFEGSLTLISDATRTTTYFITLCTTT